MFLQIRMKPIKVDIPMDVRHWTTFDLRRIDNEYLDKYCSLHIYRGKVGTTELSNAKINTILCPCDIMTVIELPKLNSYLMDTGLDLFAKDKNLVTDLKAALAPMASELMPKNHVQHTAMIEGLMGARFNVLRPLNDDSNVLAVIRALKAPDFWLQMIMFENQNQAAEKQKLEMEMFHRKVNQLISSSSTSTRRYTRFMQLAGTTTDHQFSICTLEGG